MSKKEKLLAYAKTLPKNFSFHQLETLLKQYDFERLKTNAGSHMKWKNLQTGRGFGAPYGDPVKTVYLKQFLDIIS